MKWDITWRSCQIIQYFSYFLLKALIWQQAAAEVKEFPQKCSKHQTIAQSHPLYIRSKALQSEKVTINNSKRIIKSNSIFELINGMPKKEFRDFLVIKSLKCIFFTIERNFESKVVDLFFVVVDFPVVSTLEGLFL